MTNPEGQGGDDHRLLEAGSRDRIKKHAPKNGFFQIAHQNHGQNAEDNPAAIQAADIGWIQKNKNEIWQSSQKQSQKTGLVKAWLF